MEPQYYILDENKNVVKTTVHGYAEWLLTCPDRIVKQTNLINELISTVFLGFRADSGCFFETMIFGGKYDGYKDRYKTWKQAEEGHRITVEMVINNK